MCINYVHRDRFLIPWEAFFVQCSYAMPVLLRTGFCEALRDFPSRQRCCPRHAKCLSRNILGKTILRWRY